MDRFFRWIKDHAPELAFLVAGGAAIWAGVDAALKIEVPPIAGTIVTTFGSIALAQWKARKQEKVTDDDDDDDDDPGTTPPRRRHPRSRFRR